jgi:hypothetical protein
MKKEKLVVTLIVLFSIVFFIQCSKEDYNNPQAGVLSLQITDAPSDDEDIKGIFITISAININGKPLRNFSRQTIEISKYRHGATRLLINKELAAKEYKNITLVLDLKSDISGSSPGCYVQTKDNTKHNLAIGSKPEVEISAVKNFELLTGKETTLIIDFDLRKSIVRNLKESTKSNYQFVTDSELQNAVRIVNKNKSGEITGEVKRAIKSNDKTYVIVYKEGDFNAMVEGTGNGKSGVLFAKAVTSTLVEPDGTFKLPFLEEGEYEIRLASFKKTGDTYSFNGFLNTTSRKTGMLLNNISVTAGKSVELNIEVFNLI